MACFTIVTAIASGACLSVTHAGIVTSGLTLHLDASAGVTTDGSGHVSDWADQTALGHNASAGDGFRPLLVDNLLNGHAVVRFDGASNRMDLAGSLLSSQEYTIVAVVNDTRADDSYREVISNWTGSNSITSVFLGTINTTPTSVRFTDDFGGNAPGGGGNGVGSLTNPQSHFILSAVSAADASVYQNHDPLASLGHAILPRDLSTPWSLGSQGQNSFEFWRGDMAEVLVYDRELNSTELQQTWDALDQKYGFNSPAAVPEPTAIAIWGGIGIAGLFTARRCKRVQASNPRTFTM